VAVRGKKTVYKNDAVSAIIDVPDQNFMSVIIELIFHRK